MSSLNLCVIEGHLNTKPEYFNEKKCVKFSVACNRSFNGKEEISVIVVHVDNARLADTCVKYLDLKSHVLITGYLSTDNVSTKKGAPLIIVGKEIKFLPSTKKKEVPSE